MNKCNHYKLPCERNIIYSYTTFFWKAVMLFSKFHNILSLNEIIITAIKIYRMLVDNTMVEEIETIYLTKCTSLAFNNFINSSVLLLGFGGILKAESNQRRTEDQICPVRSENAINVMKIQNEMIN